MRAKREWSGLQGAGVWDTVLGVFCFFFSPQVLAYCRFLDVFGVLFFLIPLVVFWVWMPVFFLVFGVSYLFFEFFFLFLGCFFWGMFGMFFGWGG